MELFHVTERHLEIGGQQPPAERRWNDHIRDEIESRLERSRPEGKPNRSTAFYAFESPGHALLFASSESELRDKDLHYYRVELPHPFRAPMKLTGLPGSIYESRWQEAYAAYWQPDDRWQFWEYLDTYMLVLEEIPTPSPSTMAMPALQFSKDRLLLGKLF